MKSFPISRAGLLDKIEELTEALEGLDVDDKYEDEAVDLLTQGIRVSALLPYEELHTLMLRLQIFIDNMSINLDGITIPELQQLVKSGKLTYKDLTRRYLDRIALYNDNTIKLNAIHIVNPHALEEAEKCDMLLVQNPQLAQGLFGMPVIIEDNIGSGKELGMPTTACSVQARAY